MNVRLDMILLDYVWVNVCDGNLNEVARRIGMDPSDLRKKLKTMKQGHGNFTVLTSVLTYIMEDTSIDLEALRVKILDEAARVDETCPYSIAAYEVVEKCRLLAAKKEAVEKQYMLYQAAEEFAEQLRGNFCFCCRSNLYADDCPCKKLIDLLKWCEISGRLIIR